MKVLVTSTPGMGHVLPLVPLARELLDRGHDVRWIGGLGAGAVEALGIEATEAGMPERERQQEFFRRYPEFPSIPVPERQPFMFPRLFGELAAPAMLHAVRSVVDSWTPDLVIHDAAELAAPLVSAAAGVPSVCHGFGQIVPARAVRAAGDQMAALWESHGLDPDPYAGSYRGLYIDIYPPTLRSADMSHVPRVQACRPAEGRRALGETVYVTFGTVFNDMDGALRTAVLAAAGVAQDVLVTLGPGADPASFGPVPSNVRLESYVDQALVLPTCAAVVCHAGSGTVLGALAHGVPLVCVPQAADQFANAMNVERVGAGRSLSPPDVTEASLREAISEVLDAPGPRQAARAIAREIAAMPSRAEVVDAIEAFVESPTA